MLAPSGTAQAAASVSALPLVGVIGVAIVGTALLLALAVLAFSERRSRPYLLVALAVAALFLRAVVGGASMLALLGPTTHHLVEHALDVIVVGLVIGAVYTARATDRQLDAGQEP